MYLNTIHLGKIFVKTLCPFKTSYPDFNVFALCNDLKFLIDFLYYFQEYAHWWAPLTEDIVIDKHRNKKQAAPQKSVQKDSQVKFHQTTTEELTSIIYDHLNR